MAQAQDKLNRLLYEAALNGDKAKVIELLDRGATEDVLLPAVRQGHIAVIELLLDRGADIHKYEDQALRVAARDGHIEITKLLLDHGADVHAQDDLALRYAAEHGHTKVVELLLDHGADVHVNDDIALLLAVEHGHKGTVELLLDRGANIHANNDKALRAAAYSGRTKLVELLLDRGADVHVYNDLALLLAAEHGHKGTVELLLDRGADIHAQDEWALSHVAREGYKEVVELLLDRGANVHAGDDIALRGAARYGHTEVVELLKQHMAQEQTQEQQIKEGEKTMENTNETAIPITLTGNREGEILQDQNQTKEEQTMDVKQENQNKTNEEIKNMEQNSNKTKNKIEKPINPMKEINDKISNGIKELFDSEKYKEYLQVMSKFHNYSVNNTVLIAMQMPTATNIAGFDAWKDNFSRNVIKGEKGIKIIAPTQVKIKQRIEKFDPKTDKPILGKDDKPVTEEREFTTTEFRVTNVFDVSQTRFLKDSKAPEDQGAAKNKNYKNFISAVEKSAVKNPNDFLVAIEKASPVPINITEKMNEQQALETAINEIAHAKLPKNANEIQIESVKYVLSQHYGLDTSNYSFENVSNWSEGRDVKELKSSLHTISKTASKLINDINQNIISLRQEKTQAQGNEAEPREYHEHINEKYVAYMKAREQEKAQEQAKVQAQKKSKGKTCDVGED